LLILDDWGLERLTQDQRRDTLEIVEDRHHVKSLLITSQLPIPKWHEMIGDPTIADAILDRLLSKNFKLELKGESMRKNQKSIVA
jgi:DNA replication protein DnaC